MTSTGVLADEGPTDVFSTEEEADCAETFSVEGDLKDRLLGDWTMESCFS